MSFAFLSPWALALGALVAGPLIAHLARQRPAREQTYGAMLLLRRVARRQRRRRQVQDPLLLVLRSLAVLLVCLAVAQPELRWPGAPPAVGGSGAVVVVLDNSLSMDLHQGLLSAVTPSVDDDGTVPPPEAASTGTLLASARQQAARLISDLPDGARVGVVTIGGQASRLTPQLSRDRAAVAASVADVRQSQGSTDLAGGLREARRLLGGEGGEVVVFTDEAGPTAVVAAKAELALLGQQGGALVPRPVRASSPSNLAVTAAHYGDGPEGGSVRVQVSNFGPHDVEAPVTVALPDGTEINAFIDVPAGEQADTLVTVPRVAAGGVGQARVRDAALAADDAFAFQLPRVGASRVLVVDGDPGPTPTASEVYFLERALAPWGATAAARGGVLPDVTTPAGLSGLDPAVHRVVFLANVGNPMPLAATLINFVREGGGLVISLGSNVTAQRYNDALSGLLPSTLRTARGLAAVGERGRPIALPDTSLPLFAPFARGGRAAFGQARVSRVFTLDPYEDGDSVTTLLRLDGGLPLLVERKLGQGRVLLLTTSLDLGWTDLPLQAAFMPLVQRVTSYLGGEAAGGELRRSATVGETVSIALPDAALDVSVTGPTGPVAAPVRSGTLSFRVESAGAYVVETPGAPPLAWVAANVDPLESDVRPGPSLIETAAAVDPGRFLRHLALSPWLLAAALGLALLQALLSGPRAEGAEDAGVGDGGADSSQPSEPSEPSSPGVEVSPVV